MLSNTLRGHLAELGIVSARAAMEQESCSGSSRMARGIRVSAAVRGILDVLARRYSAIGTKIVSIDKSIMVLHHACEASRRLAETGDKDRLGSITKQGNRYLQWLLVVGAMAVIR
jgi:transposase